MLHLAGILACQNSAIAQLIWDRKKSTLDEMLSAVNPGSKKDLFVARLWLNVSQDAKIRARLAAENLPMKLYHLLKEKHPER